ncbi:site-specific integrase [Metaplanococcus flavidus]|uniref:Site-specific integrase n=1 Tax=Metaplanococcus flavidus TaxID=569883 RepID=A0ABW3L872_9BACL
MELQIIDVQDFLAATARIDENTYLTNECKFGDGEWDFSSNANERRNSVSVSKLKFNWDSMAEAIGDGFVSDLKVLTYLLLFVPEIFKRNATKHNSLKINTVSLMIKKMGSVVEEIIISQQKEVNAHSFMFATCFGELSLKDFEKIPIHSTRVADVKRLLKYLSNPLIQKYLIHRVKWNTADVKTLNIVNLPKSDVKEVSSTPIEDELYMTLIKQVTIDIISFKKSMKLNVHSKVTPNMLTEIDKKAYGFDVANAFEDYIKMRTQDREYALKRGTRQANTKTIRINFKRKYGISVQAFYEEMINGQRAAILAILLFTGVRYSELISLKGNCILKRKDVYVIKGTVIKHKSDLLPTDVDEWVAIPIVRDAVEVLEQFQRFTFNSYIVSPLRTVYLNQKDLPMGPNAISEALNLYLETSKERNDTLLKYAGQPDHKITIHRLRHTLARQLIRGRLGLPYISYHLKHINAAVVAYNRTSNVTLGYGGISNEILNSAKQYHGAKEELIQEIYHPNAIVAGGRNANEFTKRKKEYFQGLMVDDAEIDDIITDLKNQSLPFLDVGLGFCGGRKDIVLEDGTKQPPPCIGQLKCNPVDCGNAVIPKSKLPIWKKVHQDTVTKLEDDQFNYMELELKEVLKRAEYVINHFQHGSRD